MMPRLLHYWASDPFLNDKKRSLISCTNFLLKVNVFSFSSVRQGVPCWLSQESQYC